MKSLTPVVPLLRGHGQCQSGLQMFSITKSNFQESDTFYSPFIKGARGILPPLTPPKTGGGLIVQLDSFLPLYQDYICEVEATKKEVDI